MASEAIVLPGEPAAGLSHSLHSRHVSMIAIGGIIGAGLFVGSSTSIHAVGPAVIVSYTLAGLVILMIMRMLSELASLHPGAGSFTELVRIGLGDRAGFVCGWLYWYFWVVVVAIEAIAGAVIVSAWLPLPVWLIGMGLLAAMTAVNLLSTRSYGEFEFWLSLMKVMAIVVFIAVAGLWAFGVTSPAGPTFGNLVAHGGFAPHGWGAAVGGVTSVIFALCGAEIATIAAAESHEPARTIARITGSVALRILLFYFCSIALIVTVMPWTEVVPGKSPFATALAHMGINGAATVMSAVVLVAVMSCLNSGLYVTSRVLFVLSDRGDAPRALVAINRRRVPARAIPDRQPVRLSCARRVGAVAPAGVQLPRRCVGRDDASHLPDGVRRAAAGARADAARPACHPDVAPPLSEHRDDGGDRGGPDRDGDRPRAPEGTGDQPGAGGTRSRRRLCAPQEPGEVTASRVRRAERRYFAPGEALPPAVGSTAVPNGSLAIAVATCSAAAMTRRTLSPASLATSRSDQPRWSSSVSSAG